MAGPKGQPYIKNNYGWPEGPAIIPRDSYLGRRPSLFIKLPTHSLLSSMQWDVGCRMIVSDAPCASTMRSASSDYNINVFYLFFTHVNY